MKNNCLDLGIAIASQLCVSSSSSLPSVVVIRVSSSLLSAPAIRVIASRLKASDCGLESEEPQKDIENYDIGCRFFYASRMRKPKRHQNHGFPKVHVVRLNGWSVTKRKLQKLARLKEAERRGENGR